MFIRIIKKWKWIGLVYLIILMLIIINGTARTIRVYTGLLSTSTPAQLSDMSIPAWLSKIQQAFVGYDFSSPDTLLEHVVVLITLMIVAAPLFIGWVSWCVIRRFIAARSQDQASTV